MKKTQKLSVFIALFFVFFLVSEAQASISQGNSDTTHSFNSTSQTYQWFNSVPDATSSSSITNVWIMLTPDNDCWWQLKLKNDAAHGLGTLNSNSLFVSSTNLSPVKFEFTANPNFRLDTVSNFSLDAGDPYCGVGQYTGVLWGSDSTTTYPNGYHSDQAGTASYDVKNLYFSINSEEAPISTTTINFSSTLSSLSDFSFWRTNIFVTGTPSSEVAENWDIGVRFGTTSTTLNIYDYQNGVSYLIDPWTLQKYYLSSQNIRKLSPLPVSQTYYAQAVLYDSKTEHSASHIRATSPVWSFLINSSEITTYPGLNTATTTTSTGSTDLSCNYAWPINKACELMKYLFYPSQESVNQFGLLKSELEDKPPFGYISAYSSSLEVLNSSTSTTSTTFVSHISQYGIVEQFKNILTWFLYLVFGVWVFNRFRKLSLQG